MNNIPNELSRLSIRVSGTVQGVYYRASAREVGLELGLVGFVKNQADGTVYLEAQGPKEALDQLISWCRVGPSSAVVRNVVVEELPLGDFQSFEVRR